MTSPNDVLVKWRQLDVALVKAWHGNLTRSKEPLHDEVMLKSREYAQTNAILEIRQIVWIMLEYLTNQPHTSRHTERP